MLGDISPQTVRITQKAVVYPSRDHVTSLRVERFDGRTYKPVDMTAVTRVILSFPEADPVIVYDSSVQSVFTHVGTTLTVDLSDYAMSASVLGCQIILYDAEHPAGQVLVDDIDAVVQFDFRNVSPVGGIPPPAVDYLTDAPIDGVTYARKDGVWVPVDAMVSGVSSVNGQSGVVVLDAADVGADAAGTGASQAASAVAAHVALSDPHPQYLTPAEGNTAYDAIGAAASAVGTHVAASDPHPQYLTPAEGNAAYDALGAAASAVSTHVAASDPHPQYNTQAEGDARYERNLTAGANITIDRTNPAAPVISASGGGGGGGAVDSVNGQTGVVVLDTDDTAEGVSNLYFTNGRAAAAAPVQTVDGQTGAVSLSSSYAPLSHVGDGGAAHSNAVAAGAAGFMTGADKTKLDGIATGATVNATNAELRDRSTHTGSQLAATISDFAGGVRGTVLTGLSMASAAAGTAADTVLVFLGKLQAQITALATTVGGKQNTLVSGTTLKTVNGTSLLGAGDLAIAGGGISQAVVRSISANETLNLAKINTFGVNSSSSNYTSTIPPQSSTSWTADAELHFLKGSSGTLTISASPGVTLNGVLAGSVTISVTNGAASIKRIALDNWWAGGLIGSPASTLGNPNLLYNSLGNINQRGYVSGTATVAANQYTIDRYRVVVSGQNLSFTASGNGFIKTAPAGGVEQVIESRNITGGSYAVSWTGTATATVNGTARANGEVFSLTANTNATVRFSGGTFQNEKVELGSSATSVVDRPYGQELALCQRYYQYVKVGFVGYSIGGANFGGGVNYKTVMRAAPTIDLVIGNIDFAAVNVGLASSYIGVDAMGMVIFRVATATGPVQFSEAVSLSAEL